MAILLAVCHLALALVCARHAVSAGHPLFWVLVVFLFPVVGVLAYLQIHGRENAVLALRPLSPFSDKGHS